MILSVSRRTDIPAFYAQWFAQRVREGFALVRNPMNRRQVSRIPLDPAVVDGIVFWTRNPRPLLEHLPQIRERYGESFYFQYTLTGYDAAMEPSVPRRGAVETFRKLSDLLGPDRVVWRYDPIVFTDRMDLDYHKKRFEELANRLGPFTRRCVVSLLDIYRKTERNMAGLGVRTPGREEVGELMSHCGAVAKRWNVSVESCAESVDYTAVGVRPGKCIDDRLISKLRGMPLDAGKDKGQRPECGCIPSIDIGTYNTCLHGCRYCYATFSESSVQKARAAYDANSPLLCDRLEADDQVKERAVRSLFTAQEGLWSGAI